MTAAREKTQTIGTPCRKEKIMGKKKTYLYPGMDAARKESERAAKEKRLQRYTEQPDIIETASGFCPNYEKFSGWNAETVLAWCNID